MPHFPAEYWIDFARNLVPSPCMTQMRDHLERDCHECQKSYETWCLVVDWSLREKFYRPPEYAVRIAKAAFVPEKAVSGLRQAAQFASLIFDSFRQPAPALVRSAAQMSRQLLHDAPPFAIDLKLEYDPSRRQTFLTGQILNAEAPNQTVTGVDVVLLRGAQLVTKTPANAAGEFSLKFNPEGDLQLFINIPGERAIGIDLPALEG